MRTGIPFPTVQIIETGMPFSGVMIDAPNADRVVIEFTLGRHLTIDLTHTDDDD